MRTQINFFISFPISHEMLCEGREGERKVQCTKWMTKEKWTTRVSLIHRKGREKKVWGNVDLWARLQCFSVNWVYLNGTIHTEWISRIHHEIEVHVVPLHVSSNPFYSAFGISIILLHIFIEVLLTKCTGPPSRRPSTNRSRWWNGTERVLHSSIQMPRNQTAVVLICSFTFFPFGSASYCRDNWRCSV